ncbi:hypothetical protein ACS0TY_003018 [Phlomoides rotata]
MEVFFYHLSFNNFFYLGEMEEVDAQVVSPMVIHQHLAARFCDLYPTAKKRALKKSFSGHVDI